MSAETGEPAGGDPEFEDYLRRMCRGIRERTPTIPPPPALGAAETAHRERVRLRALSLLGTMRPDLHDLDSLSWGEALEKVCDTIIDLWICEDCHEQGTRCSCLATPWLAHEEEALGFGEEEEDEEGDDDGDGFLPQPPSFGGDGGLGFGSGM